MRRVGPFLVAGDRAFFGGLIFFGEQSVTAEMLGALCVKLGFRTWSFGNFVGLVICAP